MRFIESILYEKGAYENLDLHQRRLSRTLENYLTKPKTYPLSSILPDLKLEGKYKVRVVYNVAPEGITYDVEYAAYLPRKIKTLEVIHSAPFDYSLKYESRDHINNLLKKTKADDIIIAIDGKITDSSYSNLAFWDGDQWVTPNTPLLKGVRRELLLDRKKIKEAPIRTSDLGAFEKVSLINAMLDLEEVEVPISHLLKT